MRNRAKCKLCNTIIESFHATDLVVCKCGHIQVDGGEALRCAAKDWANFCRIDDDDNEVAVKVVDHTEQSLQAESLVKPNKEDLLRELDDMIGNIEKLPQSAMTLPINHYDYYSSLLLMSAIFKAS